MRKHRLICGLVAAGLAVSDYRTSAEVLSLAIALGGVEV
jgi:hypothetical protein